MATQSVSLTNMGINWLAHRPAVDPYLVWAAVSEFSGFDLPQAGQHWITQIAVETSGTSPPWHSSTGDAKKEPHAICATESGVGAIWTGDVDAATLLALLTNTSYPPLAVELNVPRIRSINARILLNSTPVPVNMLSATARSVVAVIDHGCPFAHRQFLERQVDSGGDSRADLWRTRVAALWDQDADHTVEHRVQVPLDDGRMIETWLPVGPFGYGREMTATQMNDLVDVCTSQAVVDEDQVYRLADYDALEGRRVHGSHVLDMAAGAVNPMTQERDHASDAGIIFVQLPRNTVADSSGGSMTKYVLDALAYILAKTETGVDNLVVNLSYGATAGAHDGASLLERGIDLAIAQARVRKPRRKVEVVVAAGNHIVKQGHARMAFDSAHSEAKVSWQLMPDDRTDSFLELWYDTSHAPQMTVTLRNPSGNVVGRSTLGNHQRLLDSDGALVGAMVHVPRTTYGPDKAIVLIAMRPTHVDLRLTTPLGTDQAPAEHGQWGVELHCICTSPVMADAWVQRDDSMPWQGGQPQSLIRSNRIERDDNDDDVPTDSVVRRTTTSSVATGHNTMVVGAYVSVDGSLSRYSAAGPTYNSVRESSRTWPDCIAPADASDGLPGLLAAGTRSGILVRMNGTSVAAPQVARALINWWNSGTTPPIPVNPAHVPAGYGDLRDFRMGGYRLA